MSPWPVRLVRATIAVLVWGAFCIPVSSVFRWMGTELVMPPSYPASWQGFLILVGLVLFLAFFLETPSPTDDPAGTDSGERTG